MKNASPSSLNTFLSTLLSSLLDSIRQESSRLKLLVIIDGPYEKIVKSFGPICESIHYLERAVREFRKWGLGVLMTAEGLSILTDPLTTNFWTMIHLGSTGRREIERASIHFRGETPKLVRLRPGEALALSANYFYAEPFKLRLPKEWRPPAPLR